jgi:hypothetical protein
MSAPTPNLAAMHNPDPIATAQLNGAAHRLLRQQADRETCIHELHNITADPTLLGIAAGTALGAWQHWQAGNHIGYDGDRVARMLEAAGADLSVRDQVAAEVVERVADGRASGIGNP